jgi:hypothetical protein
VADRIQSLAVRRGYRCNLCVEGQKSGFAIHILRIRDASCATVARGEFAESSLKLPEKVWCVQTRNGTIFVRRHGKVAVMGNSWHRHGSLNADREWRLGLTDHLVSAMREDAFRKPPGDPDKPPEPLRCPRCFRVLARPACPCGWELRGGRKSRPVVQADGTLREVTGDVFRPRRISQAPDGPKLWAVMVKRSCTDKGNRTFRAAMALFAHENDGRWPDPSWPLMPKNPDDVYCHVKDVPRERLR